MRVPSAFSFSQLFRHEAQAAVEYSFDDAVDRQGVMIGMSNLPADRLRSFAADLPFAGDWLWAIERFRDAARPDAFLLRADFRSDRVTALTLYSRFPSEPSDETFHRLLRTAAPFRWTGPSPAAAASVLHVIGPRGIGFRVNATGLCRTSIYFRVPAAAPELKGETLQELCAVSGLPPELAMKIGEDVHDLYTPGPVGVIGLDDGPDGRAGALKFDPANVPLQKAFAFVARKKAAPSSLARLAATSRALRASSASYLGIKYGVNGFSGWRMYFSLRPGLLAVPFAPRTITERSQLPTYHLPHY
jgi:hypothetical protein